MVCCRCSKATESSELTLIEGTANAALIALDQACPWEEQGWLLPFSAAEVAMTWNGVPVTSDTVWADAPGEFTLEASWWDGRFSWSRTVESGVDVAPVLTVDVDPAVCWGDSAWVEWEAPETGSVFMDEADVTQMSGWAVHETDTLNLLWLDSPGCLLNQGIIVHIPDSALVELDVQTPACAGEMGQVDVTVSGGTPPWSVDWMGMDSSALFAGVYSVSLVDSMGCSLMDTVVVEEPDLLDVEVSWSHFGLSDSAQVELIISGGTPPMEQLWTGGFDNGFLLSPDLIGWLVEDASGCIAFGTVDVPSNPLLDVGEVSPLTRCIRDESGLRFTGDPLRIEVVDIVDFTGRLLHSGSPDHHGRIVLAHTGLVVVRVTDKAGAVWTLLR